MQQAGSEQEQAAVVEPQLAATPATEAARALVVDGAARVCGVLNESLCDRLRAEIDALYIRHHPERLTEVDGLLAQVRALILL